MIYFIFVHLALINLTSFLLLLIAVPSSPFLLANAHNLKAKMKEDTVQVLPLPLFLL